MIVVGVSSFLLFAVCSNDPKLKDGNTGCQYPFSLARLALLGLPGNACDSQIGSHALSCRAQYYDQRLCKSKTHIVGQM